MCICKSILKTSQTTCLFVLPTQSPKKLMFYKQHFMSFVDQEADQGRVQMSYVCYVIS